MADDKIVWTRTDEGNYHSSSGQIRKVEGGWETYVQPRAYGIAAPMSLTPDTFAQNLEDAKAFFESKRAKDVASGEEVGV